jgi:hypothetical protein
MSFTIAAGPRQRSHSRVRVPEGLMTIFYCLKFETPPTWRARSPFLYPPGTWMQLTQQLKVKVNFATGGLPPIISSWRETP